jgi:hypothetical protein
MSRASVLILLGVLVILAPFSGFPIALRSLFSLVLGACVVGIGLMLRTRDTQPRAETHAPTMSAAEPAPEAASFPPETYSPSEPPQEPRDVSPI